MSAQRHARMEPVVDLTHLDHAGGWVGCPGYGAWDASMTQQVAHQAHQVWGQATEGASTNTSTIRPTLGLTFLRKHPTRVGISVLVCEQLPSSLVLVLTVLMPSGSPPCTSCALPAPTDLPVDPQQLTPWFAEYREEYLRLMTFGEHETLDHPVAGGWVVWWGGLVDDGVAVDWVVMVWQWDGGMVVDFVMVRWLWTF